MLSLLLRRHHGRHEAPPPQPPREMPATPPPPERFWPVLRWLEQKAAGIRSDPVYEAEMAALAAELDTWQREQDG